MDITNIPPPRVPVIDERTGLMAREWYRFLLNLFQLTGSGTSPITLTDSLIEPSVKPVDMGPAIQEAQLLQRMARYDAAIAALDGALMQPPAKPCSEQFDPLSFGAPYAR